MKPFHRENSRHENRREFARSRERNFAENAENPPRAAVPAPQETRSRDEFVAPWVQLKYFTYNPNIYPRFVGKTSGSIAPGTQVRVYGKDGSLFGHGFFNAGANIPLRIFDHARNDAGNGRTGNESNGNGRNSDGNGRTGDRNGESNETGGNGAAAAPGTDFFENRLRRAAEFRTKVLNLPARTDAFRVVHGDADGLNGLVVDKYGDVLSAEVFSLAVYQRIRGWLPILHDALGTSRETVQLVKGFGSMENARGCEGFHTPGLREVKIRENGVRYGVDFENGHKTGFFCDQRENRARLAELCAGARVLDLCCYTGGFSLAAKVHGNAADVTGVDLDETAIAQARRNANLNQTRVNFVHADAFTFTRQMQANGAQFDVVVLDPPKLINGRDDYADGVAKYHDLNKVALPLVRRGGIFVTFSCSGLLSAENFESTVIRVAHRLGRRLQIFARSGPGADHPDISNYPEGRYLKALWCVVL